MPKEKNQEAEAKEAPEKSEKSEKPSWVTLKPAELEKIVVDLHKKSLSPPQIGLVLRDQYGVPKAKLLGKRVTQILKGANISPVTQKQVVEDKIKKLEQHSAKHKHDYSAKRSLAKQLWTVSKF